MSEENEIIIPVEKTVWYKNITFWTNVVVVVGLILTTYFGVVMPATLQASILAIVNIVLQSPSMASTEAKAISHNKGIRARMFR